MYALGVPLGEDSALFANHLAECETCRVLLSEGREAAALLGGSVAPIAPRPEVKRRILAGLAEPSGTRIPVREGRPDRFTPWFFAAAATLLFTFVVWDDARIRRERSDLRSQTAFLSAKVSSAEKDLARRDLQVRVLESEDVRVLILGGKDPQPAARAKVFWSARAKRGVLLAGNLQPLSAGKQYELWVFAAGKPVAAGVFDADSQGRALVESSDLSGIDSAQKFAVTIEPEGGGAAPTGPIVLVGAA